MRNVMNLAQTSPKFDILNDIRGGLGSNFKQRNV